MVKVTFADGTVVNFEDGSNSINMTYKASSFADLDEIRGLFTAANLYGMEVGEEFVTNVLPVGVTVGNTPADAEFIYAVFNNREKTELELICEKQEIQNEAIDMLLGM